MTQGKWSSRWFKIEYFCANRKYYEFSAMELLRRRKREFYYITFSLNYFRMETNMNMKSLYEVKERILKIALKNVSRQLKNTLT